MPTTPNCEGQHAGFCFAGQPAPCDGYFPNDVLPCVCGADGDALSALSRVAIPAQPRRLPVPFEPAPAELQPVDGKAA